ncbi:unnamed protein product, partial [Didymodactylos carnosus]
DDDDRRKQHALIKEQDGKEELLKRQREPRAVAIVEDLYKKQQQEHFGALSTLVQQENLDEDGMTLEQIRGKSENTRKISTVMGHKPFGTELDHDSFLDDNNRLVLVVCDPVITNTFERHVAKQRTSFYVLEDEKLPIGSVPLNMLQNSVTDYLIRKKVILNKQKTFYTMTEEELILNRLQNIVDIEQQNMNICPTHRYTYGTGFRIDNHCYHPDHQKERQSKKKTYKVATLQQCNNIPSFPISGTLCSKYHTKMYAQDNLTTISQPSIPNIIKSAPGSTASVASAEERVTSRETANSLLAVANLNQCSGNMNKSCTSLAAHVTLLKLQEVYVDRLLLHYNLNLMNQLYVRVSIRHLQNTSLAG